MRECYAEPTDARLRALIRCVRPATIKYAAWQISAGGAAALPDWTPPPQEIGDEYHVKNRRADPRGKEGAQRGRGESKGVGRRDD
eukprot:886931-Pleurochrysis_carterae.AAC.1